MITSIIIIVIIFIFFYDIDTYSYSWLTCLGIFALFWLFVRKIVLKLTSRHKFIENEYKIIVNMGQCSSAV